jgi:hypothetical protein
MNQSTNSMNQSMSKLLSHVEDLEALRLKNQYELQQVVGSKYHDFIDSDESIDKMLIVSKKIQQRFPQLLNDGNLVINFANVIIAPTSPLHNSESSILISLGEKTLMVLLS